MTTLRRIVLAATIVLALQAAPVFGQGLSVAIWGDADGNLADVRVKIMGAGTFDTVDTFNVYANPRREGLSLGQRGAWQRSGRLC